MRNLDNRKPLSRLRLGPGPFKAKGINNATTQSHARSNISLKEDIHTCKMFPRHAFSMPEFQSDLRTPIYFRKE
jgi:hypothetical protein